MKNILLATDFSINAHIAALCAGEITQHLGGRLILFHALPPVFSSKNIAGKIKSYLTEEATQKKMDKLAYEVREKFNISVSRLIKPGFAEDEIPALAERLKAVVIVMGACGEGKEDGNEVGSVAREVLSKSQLPVVCVPPGNICNLNYQIKSILDKKKALCNEAGVGYLDALINKT